MSLYSKNPVSKAKKPERSAILISIKPDFVQKIRAGTKKYELRRQIKPVRSLPEMMVIYETAPTKQITGFFQCTTFWTSHKDTIWDSGIDQFWDIYSEIYGLNWWEFYSYFEGVIIGYCLKISRYIDIEPLKLQEIGINYAPQNMQFLNREQWLTIFDRRIEVGTTEGGL